MLDGLPSSPSDVRRWRGREFFRGQWDATPTHIAYVVGARLHRELAVHTVYRETNARWVVLRSETRYSGLDPASRA